MPNYTTPAMPPELIVRRAYWRTQIIDNMRVLNDFFGNTNGAHASFTDGGILLGNGQGAFTAMSVLAKGSLVSGDGATDPAELTVGSNDDILKGDSGQTPGVAWETDNWAVAEYMIYG